MAINALEPILANSEWLAHRYDAEADAYHLRHLTREGQDSATFLTDEYLGAEFNPIVVSRRDAMQMVSKNNSLHFIIHSAFCASTLLAKGFNLPGLSMGLKEPVLLNDIVGYRRRGAPPRAVAERLDHALHMLARPIGDDRTVIVKPSNVFNALLPVTLAMRPTSNAILLYAPLPVFLVSVARKGLWCRLWCRELLEGLLTDGLVDLGFEPADYFRQSDLQVAAVGWLAQQLLFRQIVDKYGPARVATLDSEQLTKDPQKALLAAARHFGVAATETQIQNHPAFSTHSKFGGSYSREEREAEHAAARAAYGEEIDTILKWAEQVADSAGVDLNLPCPLI